MWGAVSSLLQPLNICITWEKRRQERGRNVPENVDNPFVFIQTGKLAFHMRRQWLTFSEYMEGELMGLITTMLGPAWVCTRLLPYRCRRECITLDSFKYCREARSSTRSNVGGFAWNVKPDVVASVTNAARRSCDDWLPCRHHLRPHPIGIHHSPGGFSPSLLAGCPPLSSEGSLHQTHPKNGAQLLWRPTPTWQQCDPTSNIAWDLLTHSPIVTCFNIKTSESLLKLQQPECVICQSRRTETRSAMR